MYSKFPADALIHSYYYIIVINVEKCKCLYYTILERVGDDPIVLSLLLYMFISQETCDIYISHLPWV